MSNMKLNFDINGSISFNELNKVDLGSNDIVENNNDLSSSIISKPDKKAKLYFKILKSNYQTQ